MAEDQAARLRTLAQGINQTSPSIHKFLRVIAVSSGKGGVGKTNVSINLALALADLGKRVVVFDGDLGLANVDVICGLTPKYTLEDVVVGSKSVTEVLMDGPKGIKILPGASGNGIMGNLENSSLQALLDKMMILDGMADFLIIDTGAGIARGVIQLLEASDEVIVVITPEPTSLTDAYGLVKTLFLRGKRCRIDVVVNRVKSKEEAEATFSRLEAAMDRFLKYKVGFLGYIYEDSFVSRAVMRQTPVSILFPTAPASQCLKLVAKNLIGAVSKANAPSRGMRGFVEGLVAHFSMRYN